MKRCSLILFAALACPLLWTQQAAQPDESNPFFKAWNTPFGVPPFEQIKNEHFLPAIQRAIEEQKREAEAIASRAEAPSFANTIAALDAAGELIQKVQGVFGNLTSAETNDQLQDIARQVAPRLSALRDDIVLNPQLFARVKAVWERRASLKLDAEQRKLLEETYKTFVRGGANLGPE
ncbi:MAG: peptidase M3, partial [Acidobacteria bacterium]|nr:peptidase M3 [Acidobacteriota bacterium]